MNRTPERYLYAARVAKRNRVLAGKTKACPICGRLFDPVRPLPGMLVHLYRDAAAEDQHCH